MKLPFTIFTPVTPVPAVASYVPDILDPSFFEMVNVPAVASQCLLSFTYVKAYLADRDR
ncbi:hypothetical protein [Sphingobacterium composti Ten et al. 2007 non Yoo et al. 2007]|uniref:hypothetical protein n=1 Tax=Sphingobacterium composti TaxID=363260 RepID=UPI00135A771B|nr:hypothetical protein [Sphingobacterium composti Ten et al. 2007 non Yoo et al. 2007]